MTIRPGRRTRAALGLALGMALLASAPARAQETPGVERVNGSVRFNFPNAPLTVLVPALAEVAGINVVYSSLPDRTFSVVTPNPVPTSLARTYLERVLQAANLRLVEEGGIFRIEGGEPQQPAVQQPGPGGMGAVGQGGPQQIYIHPLRHAPAEDIARTIGALFGIGDPSLGGAGNQMRALSDELRDQRLDLNPSQLPPGQQRGLRAELAGNVQIVPDPRTNSLAIRASASDYATIRAAIERLDTRPLQVLIEVVIAEVRRNSQFSLGLGAELPEQQVEGSDTRLRGSLTGATTAGGLLLRVTRLGGVQLDLVLSALSASGEATILSRPVVLAQNNEQARILVGDQRPFIQISRALPTENAARDQVVQYRDVGTQLTIRPTINPDGYVTLQILQEVNSATGETQFGAPVVSTREAETRLLVKDGNTVVIGGLIDQQRSSSNSGIPVLKDIPLLGNLFRSSSRNRTVTELFVFIIPHVLYSDEDVSEATGLVRERAPRLDKALPDSIPLYWRERADTLGAPLPNRPQRPRGNAPAQPQGGTPPQPQPQQPDGPQSFLAPVDPRRAPAGAPALPDGTKV